MVEAKSVGTLEPAANDGVVRHVQYARWRTNKEADPGYSRDLVNIDTPESCYDDFNQLESL